VNLKVLIYFRKGTNPSSQIIPVNRIITAVNNPFNACHAAKVNLREAKRNYSEKSGRNNKVN